MPDQRFLDIYGPNPDMERWYERRRMRDKARMRRFRRLVKKGRFLRSNTTIQIIPPLFDIRKPVSPTKLWASQALPISIKMMETYFTTKPRYSMDPKPMEVPR